MRIRNTAVPLFAAAVLLGACSDQAPEPTAPSADIAVQAQRQFEQDLVRDRYIVEFRDDTPGALALGDRLAAEHGATVHYRYEHALKGFAATLSPQAVEALRRNPHVKRVEADHVVHPTTIQYNAPWGLDRVDQISLPLSGYFNYGGTGLGVKVYVVDTGIALNHPEFEGRATSGWDFIGNDADASDCHGHGTHVAGIVGAKTYGVAKQAALVSVRVFNCSGGAVWVSTPTGTVSSVVAGINWVLDNHTHPSVANLSLTDTAGSAILDQATQRLIDHNITVVTGAAHTMVNGAGTTWGRDACLNSPARVPAALTVSASDPNDSRVINKYNGAVTWTANYGPCVDLFAPGDDIPSTWYDRWTGALGTMTMGGTSQAAPHVAGFAARYLQTSPSAAPATGSSYSLSWANNGQIVNEGPSTTKNLMYTGHKTRACCG